MDSSHEFITMMKENKMFEELANQTVEDGKVTAVTTHFSTYVLLNKVEFDKVWDSNIKAAAGENTLNVAFSGWICLEV